MKQKQADELVDKSESSEFISPALQVLPVLEQLKPTYSAPGEPRHTKNVDNVGLKEVEQSFLGAPTNWITAQQDTQ